MHKNQNNRVRGIRTFSSGLCLLLQNNFFHFLLCAIGDIADLFAYATLKFVAYSCFWFHATKPTVYKMLAFHMSSYAAGGLKYPIFSNSDLRPLYMRSWLVFEHARVPQVKHQKILGSSDLFLCAESVSIVVLYLLKRFFASSF